MKVLTLSRNTRHAQFHIWEMSNCRNLFKTVIIYKQTPSIEKKNCLETLELNIELIISFQEHKI